jgi:hypothetical protein
VLHSTIPGADVWLLNPSGVVFGQGAHLDVPGSFHASTGDYVVFGEGKLVRFYAHDDPSRPSVLSTAPPTAFGFLEESGAPAISLGPGASLEVQAGRSLELVAGDVSFTGAEVVAPGAVSIRAGRLVMTEGSQVLAENKSTVPSADPDEPGPGSISVDASEYVRVDASLLSVNTTSANAGSITVVADALTISEGGFIAAGSFGSGAGGNIQIPADNYCAFPGSVVDASSDLGIDGIVEVHAPDVDLAGKIAALPSSFLDAASLMRERCAARRSGECAGSFAVRGNGGIPAEPDGWLPATVAFDSASGPTPALGQPSVASSPLLTPCNCR